MMALFSAFSSNLLSIALIIIPSLKWSALISPFICCRAGEVGSLDLRPSRALHSSNISAGTGSVLLRLCRPDGIWCDAAFRMMVHKTFSPMW